MVTLKIDNRTVNAEEGTTIIEAAAAAGIRIPSLCYLKNLCDAGACRICVVEIDGDSKLSAACNTLAEDGMSVLTNSRRVREARLANVEMILSEHNSDCPTCDRNKNCSLQTLAENLGVGKLPYEKKYKSREWPPEYPLIRDESRCVKCMRCIKVCDTLQSLGVWDTRNSAARLTVGVTGGASIEQSDCVLCGQCVVNCPVGALKARDDTNKVLDALFDPERVVVVQIAPAVRAAWGEDIGLDRNKATVGRMAAAVRALGADYVFDTDFAADLTVMEEGAELLQRLTDKGKYSFPLFTSCCPGWVSFAKKQYPELLPSLSTAKSPQQMFGAVAKSWFAQRLDIDPQKIFSVSIMPCMAKKAECVLPQMYSAGAGQDVDAVLTSRELCRMLRACNINAEQLADESFDSPLGESTGAAVIFGATGGVMEAALRTAHYLAAGSNPEPEKFSPVRDSAGYREVTVEVGGTPVRIAVANGLANARKLIEKIKNGEAEYDFVEIMACPGGCVGGGGQPIRDGMNLAPERAQVLYGIDQGCDLRFSHENPSVLKVYEEFFNKPLSQKAHELLHTDHK